MPPDTANAPRPLGRSLTITVGEADGRLMPVFQVSDEIQVATLVTGRPVAEVAETLPRVFNLCRAAQEGALRLCLGLPPDPEGETRLRAEILRDHVLHFCFLLPARFGLPPLKLPAGWAEDPDATAAALFGPGRTLPHGLGAFADWLAAGQGAAPVLTAIANAFAPGEAVNDSLPLAPAAAPCENSPAARHSAHPLLREIKGKHGRGPLWRATGRLVDAGACLDGTIPAPVALGPGRASAPSARGLYTVSAKVSDGVVMALSRRTPTDDMIAPDGALATAIAALPPARRHLLPLLVQLFDPCMSVRIEAADA